MCVCLCEGECRTPAWQIGKLPKNDNNCDDNEKTVTREQKKKKHNNNNNNNVQINISRAEEGGGGNRGRRGFKIRLSRVGMETIKPRSHSGGYADMLQSLNTPAGVCVCSCAYDMKTHSIVGSEVKDTVMKVFIFKFVRLRGFNYFLISFIPRLQKQSYGHGTRSW